MYVTTCPVTFQLRPQTVPDSEQSSEKRGLNCEELRDRYTGPPRGTVKELGYPCPEGHGKMRGSRHSHMLENTLFRCFPTLGTLIKWLRHSDKVRDTPRTYLAAQCMGLKSAIP
jgi:hypothetical protein